MPGELANAKLVCEQHLKAMEKMFSPSMRLTLVVRCTDLDDADIVITRDDLDEVVVAIQRLAASQDADQKGGR